MAKFRSATNAVNVALAAATENYAVTDWPPQSPADIAEWCSDHGREQSRMTKCVRRANVVDEVLTGIRSTTTKALTAASNVDSAAKAEAVLFLARYNDETRRNRSIKEKEEEEEDALMDGAEVGAGEVGAPVPGGGGLGGSMLGGGDGDEEGTEDTLSSTLACTLPHP